MEVDTKIIKKNYHHKTICRDFNFFLHKLHEYMSVIVK